jgi:hypothetical protein
VTANPVIRLIEAPVAALTDLAWVCVLLAALVATWWAGGRNLLYLDEHYQDGWLYLVPFWYALRVIALLVTLAANLWLLAGIIAVFVS